MGGVAWPAAANAVKAMASVVFCSAFGVAMAIYGGVQLNGGDSERTKYAFITAGILPGFGLLVDLLLLVRSDADE